MDHLFKLLQVRQIDERTAPWRQLAHTTPPRTGWVAAIRKALAMTSSQLASRLGITPQAVLALERREREGAATIAALRRAAAALDCDLLYAIVPRKPVAENLWDRARAIAERRLKPVAHSMHLEAQTVSSGEHDKLVDDFAAQILRESPRDIWSEEPPAPE